ncbi:uncharacterized protein N7518_002765 [Penicillium psychrosexuale]|uniref:uncharacterized protein n=1 Tax=Penicillium psychrosexuale TaxID=1002107 RepID=UPI00254527C7|nr:uncharacterized protein N7518_002765 [Penicillium psychrosexuale]KAJ5800697.1 hypothetical protein N7518_002765 [Penicillium psychrosexuale]
MDKNKKDEHSQGSAPITSQHHTKDMALFLQDKNHSLDLVPQGEEEPSRQGIAILSHSLLPLLKKTPNIKPPTL